MQSRTSVGGINVITAGNVSWRGAKSKSFSGSKMLNVHFLCNISHGLV